MTHKAIMTLAAAAVAASLVPSLAGAQTRLPGRYFDPSREAPPLVVRGRPFTDSGTAVPVGYDNAYMTDQTINSQPVYSSFNPDGFGRDVLPHRFDGLGLN